MKSNKEKYLVYDISILLPTIRTHLLEDLYKSIETSCIHHSFELIMVGPFDIPEKLLKKDNVKYIKDYGSPTRAMQIALINASGKLVHTLVDDCFYYPYMLSDTINIFYNECVFSDIVGMRFFENPEHYESVKSGKTLFIDSDSKIARNISHPDNYWYAGGSYGNLQGVNGQWGSACLFLASTELVQSYGGWDCQFEYNNHATHDMLFRMQQNGSRFCITAYDIFVANWYEGTTVDHSPVHYGQLTHDAPLFTEMWKYKNNRRKIDIQNYTRSDEIWTRRFKDNNRPDTYDKMMEQLP